MCLSYLMYNLRSHFSHMTIFFWTIVLEQVLFNDINERICIIWNSAEMIWEQLNWLKEAVGTLSLV